MENSRKKHTGIIAIMISAMIFGFTPILAKITYQGGSNGIMATFLRAVFAMPVLYIILRIKHISLGLAKTQWRELIIAGGLGSGLTMVFLYMSYDYINVGLATPLHFCYPLLVVLCCSVLFREKMGKLVWMALTFGIAGIFCLIEPGSSVSVVGVTLSLLSGITYALYIIVVDKTSLKEMHYLKLSFYLCLMMAVVALAAGLGLRKMTWNLTRQAWYFSFLVSMFTSVFALSLFQIGIRLSGAASASMLSTLEPITGIMLGIWILKEELSFLKFFGVICIIISVLVVVKSGKSI